MLKSILALAVTALALLSPYMVNYVGADSSSVQGTGHVSILVPTCGISYSNLNVDYGQLFHNGTSSEQQITLQNNGNTNEVLTMNGTNWTDGFNTFQMPANQTAWSLTSTGVYAGKTPLSTSTVFLGTLAAGGIPFATYWQLKIGHLAPTFSGNLYQTMTFTGSC